MSTDVPPAAPRPPAPGLATVHARLDAVLGRIRLLRVSAGLARLAWAGCVALAALYALDRWLDLPRAVRAALLLLLTALAARELLRRVARPLFRGPGRLDAARVVERARPDFEGRIVSALQLAGGAPGSLERQVVEEAAAACAGQDLRRVLVARPSLREAWRAAGAAAALAVLLLVARPHVDVFVRRWLLEDQRWPRDVRLSLVVAERGPAHLLAPDGTLIAARGGVIEADARNAGSDPGRVELLADGRQGARATAMSVLPEGGWRGRLQVQEGDTALFARGGDDDGRDSRLSLRVIEPPRLDQPRFRLVPPAYLGAATSEVGPEGLSLPEGTEVTLSGTPVGSAESGELRLAGRGLAIPLAFDRSVEPPVARAAFTADESDTLTLVLTGEWGLATPDPSHHALMVLKDRPPTLRVFAPARADVKVTARAVVPVAVVADDDHAVASVLLAAGNGAQTTLVPDAVRPTHYRAVLDLAAAPQAGPLAYALRASDARDLPGRGPQSAVAEGRRLDVVDDAEVQRLLADRQLRLKEAFGAIRERQVSALQAVVGLLAAPPAADDPELLAAVVAQGQVTARLTQQSRELCAILDETLFNRLDPGPGAAGVLQQRLTDWAAAPADEAFAPAAIRALAAEYAGGRFGRLDLVGRLLDMGAIALQLEQQGSPEAHRLLGEARVRPDATTLQAARDAQQRVVAGLDQLLQRMDEWEDYQEVLLLVKALIDDQRGLRARTQEALSGAKESP